jgi:hypothetical protein
MLSTAAAPVVPERIGVRRAGYQVEPARVNTYVLPEVISDMSVRECRAYSIIFCTRAYEV